MIAGIGLVALSMVVMLRVTPEADPLAREDLAFALSVVLLGLLIMVGLPLAMCDSVIAEEQDVSATALRGARRLLRAFARTRDENAIAARGASQGPALVRVRV